MRGYSTPFSALLMALWWFLQDLATAFVKVLKNERAYGQVYNISGSKYVTFDGIAKACAKVWIHVLIYAGPLLGCSFRYTRRFDKFIEPRVEEFLLICIAWMSMWTGRGLPRASNCALQPQGFRLWKEESFSFARSGGVTYVHWCIYVVSSLTVFADNL